jgi:hypothetical protein
MKDKELSTPSKEKPLQLKKEFYPANKFDPPIIKGSVIIPTVKKDTPRH